MKCIIGLGNPGATYAKNYHNIGLIFARWFYDYLKARSSIEPKYIAIQESSKATYDCVKFQDFYLIFPKEYMNLSFKALQPIVSLHKIPITQVLVMHDELMKKRGVLQIKNGGGNAGHNGLRSITEHIGNDYSRLQIGIEHPKNLGLDCEVSSYVLSDIFDMNFYKALFEEKAIKLIEDWLK